MARRHALKLMAGTGAKAAAMTGIATMAMSSKADAMGFPWHGGHEHHHGGWDHDGDDKGGTKGGGGGGIANCFLKGTMIATQAGEVATENLKIGDIVATADKGSRP